MKERSPLQRLFDDIDREEADKPIVIFTRRPKEKKVNLNKKK